MVGVLLGRPMMESHCSGVVLDVVLGGWMVNSSPGNGEQLTWEWWTAHLGMVNSSPGNGEQLTWEWWTAHLGMVNSSPGNGEQLTWEWWTANLGMVNSSLKSNTYLLIHTAVNTEYNIRRANCTNVLSTPLYSYGNSGHFIHHCTVPSQWLPISMVHHFNFFRI